MSVIRCAGDIVPGMRVLEAEAFVLGQSFAVHGPFIALPEEERSTLRDAPLDGTRDRGPKYIAPLVRQYSSGWTVRVVLEKEYLELKRQGVKNPARGQFELRIPNIGESGEEEPTATRRRDSAAEDLSHLHTDADEDRLRAIGTVQEYRRFLARC